MKNGPTTWASETTHAPRSRAAARCASASCRDAREPSALQRLGHRPEGSQVGARAHDDLRPARAQLVDRLGQVAHGLRDRHPVGDVVAADHDDRHVRPVRRRQGRQLGGEHAALGPDDRGGPQPHRPPGLLGDPPGQPATQRVLGPLGAETRRDGVAEDERGPRARRTSSCSACRRPGRPRRAACRSRGEPGRPAGAAARGRRTPSRLRRRRGRPAPRRPGSGACSPPHLSTTPT